MIFTLYNRQLHAFDVQGHGGANASIANVRAHAYAKAMHIVVVTNQDNEDNMKDYISRHKKCVMNACQRRRWKGS